MGRLISVGVIAAAGLAGWLVVDTVALAPPAGAVAAPPSANPWPETFRTPTTTWDSFTTRYRTDGVLRQQSSTDAASGRTRIVSYGAAGEATWIVEISGLDAWYREAGGDEWTRPEQGLLEAFVYSGIGGVEPSHLSEIVPRWADSFVSVAEQPLDGANTRLVATIDAAGLRTTDPVRFHRWASGMNLGPGVADTAGTWTWTLDVRPDGHIVRWAGRYGTVEVWTENPADLVFESPLPAQPDPPPVAAPIEPDPVTAD